MVESVTMKNIILLIFAIFLVNVISAAAKLTSGTEFLVLCYHDIPEEVNLDNYGVDRASFIQQIEYLRTHGYNFISLKDVIMSNKGEKTLPEKAVLLTFDDGYLSFYEFVSPLLELYGYPCVLAIVTDWIDNPPPDIKLPFMNWEQLKEVAESDLIEIASHSHALHHGVLYNPQGNTSWAATSRTYKPDTGAYESEDEFRKRIHDDLLMTKETFKQNAGIDVGAVIWPYGQYNQICLEETKKLGFETAFFLEEKFAHVDNIYEIPRCLIRKNPSIGEFIIELKKTFSGPVRHRIIQADLDLIYDPDTLQQKKNLDNFIERIFNMKVSTVYLQAFCDIEGTGNISSVYFPNRVLPMEADIFNRVVNQLFIREIQVYAWLPMLSIVLPDEKETESLRVREFSGGEKRLSTSWYERLSPFSPEARRKLAMLYEDMAVNARIAGVVFQDDGYLNDFEDFHPDAVKEYRKISGSENIPFENLNEVQQADWTRIKTKTLIELTDSLKNAVLRHRPYSKFTRTIYAPVLLEPYSEEWFAQNYTESLEAYDYVMIMSYPYLEKVNNAEKWLEKLVVEAKKYPGGIEKTIFKVQTYDWEKKRWIKTETVDKWLRILVASGARHVGYYPDDFIENKPDELIIKLMMSVEDFPFKRIKK